MIVSSTDDEVSFSTSVIKFMRSFSVTKALGHLGYWLWLLLLLLPLLLPLVRSIFTLLLQAVCALRGKERRRRGVRTVAVEVGTRTKQAPFLDPKIISDFRPISRIPLQVQTFNRNLERNWGKLGRICREQKKYKKNNFSLCCFLLNKVSRLWRQRRQW